MKNKDIERILRGFESGKKTCEGYSLFPSNTNFGTPDAGSVFFQTVGSAGCKDEYDWIGPGKER